MPRRIYEQESRNVEFYSLLLYQRTGCFQIFRRIQGKGNLLGYSSCLPHMNRALPEPVKQAGFSVIDVSDYCDDWLANLCFHDAFSDISNNSLFLKVEIQLV